MPIDRTHLDADTDKIKLARQAIDSMAVWINDAETASATKGSAKIGFIQNGVGATNRTVQNKLFDFVSVNDFGAVGDGVTDDRNAFQAALTYVGSIGGGVVAFDGNHFISTSITIPDLVTLQGPIHSSGQIPHTGTGSGNYESKSGVLKIPAGQTINIGYSACLSGAFVIRSGLDLPFTSVASAQAGLSAFSGTAITIVGDNAEVNSCMILGFEYAITSANYQRHKIADVMGDCNNGIHITYSKDVSYIQGCHFWPFTTANYTWTASDTTQMILTRPGVAFNLQGTVDWGKLDNCFSYGYFRGYRLADVASCTLTNCSADGPAIGSSPAYAGCIGFLVEGNSFDNKIIAATAQGMQSGYQLSQTAGCNELLACNAAGCNDGITVSSGDCSLIGGLIRSCNNGVVIGSAASKVQSVAQSFILVNGPINPTIGTTNVVLVNPNFSGISAGVNPIVNNNIFIPSVPSASAVDLPRHANFVEITGTTNINTLVGGWCGRQVTLRFISTLTVAHTFATNAIKLTSGANYAVSANSTLTVVHNGVQWFEVGRSA